MSKGIKPFQVKHLFSKVVCNVKGQGVLKHVKMLITLTPHAFLEAGKKDTLVYWGGLALDSEPDLFFSEKVVHAFA